MLLLRADRAFVLQAASLPHLVASQLLVSELHLSLSEHLLCPPVTPDPGVASTLLHSSLDSLNSR